MTIMSDECFYGMHEHCTYQPFCKCECHDQPDTAAMLPCSAPDCACDAESGCLVLKEAA